MKAARVFLIICAVLLGLAVLAAVAYIAVEPVRSFVLDKTGVEGVSDFFREYAAASVAVCAGLGVVLAGFVASLCVLVSKKKRQRRVRKPSENTEAVAAARRAAVAELEAAKAVLDSIEKGGSENSRSENSRKGQ